MIVADTNLIAHLLIETEFTPLAEACGRRDPVWIAPAVWRHEFINVLSQYVRTRGLSVNACLNALGAADRFVETITARGGEEHVIRWAATNRMATYDAEFVIAAEIADVRLVTADQKLLDKCGARAVSLQDFAHGK